jgi:hypothetical protein
MHDTTIQALDIQVVPAEDHIQLVVATGIVLPVGNGQALPLPTGVYRVPMSKIAAQTRGQELIDAAENLPDPPPTSDLIVPGSPAEVQAAAAAHQRINDQFKAK